MIANIHPEVEQMLMRWHELVSRRDMRELPGLLHPEVVFRSPFAHTPYTGAAKVAALLGTVIQVFEDFVYERQFVAQDSVALEFRARVGKLSLKGIDLIRCDAQGKIVEFEVMIRPANALLALGEEMGKRLAAQGVAAG